MKRTLFFTFAILLTAKLSMAQAPQWLWAKVSTGIGSDYGSGISADNKGNLFLSGATGGMTLGGVASTLSSNYYYSGENPFSGRMDTAGNGTWFKDYAFGAYNPANGFYRDVKDNTYSTGLINSQDGMFIDKYNSSGTLMWHDSINTADIIGYAVAADKQGNVYVAGDFGYGSVTLGSTTLQYNGTQNAIFIARLDSNGKFIWAKSAYGVTPYDGIDYARAIVIDSSGSNIYIAGCYAGVPVFDTIYAVSTGSQNLFIAKYDSSGNALKVICVNGAAPDIDPFGRQSIALDKCNNIYVAGYFQYTAYFDSFTLAADTNYNIYVAKCTSNGIWQWVKDIGGANGNAKNPAMVLDKDNDIYVSGQYASPATIDSNTLLPVGNSFVAKFSNSNGAVQWVQVASSDGNGFGINAIAVDNSKYVYVTGDLYTTATFGNTVLTPASGAGITLAKLDTVLTRTITPAIINPQNFDSAYCEFESYTLPYAVTGTFNSGNIFTAQLSDTAGSFANPLNIGSISATTDSTIFITIPYSIPYGTKYQLRVVSSNPPVSSYATCNDNISVVICEGINQLTDESEQFTIYPNPSNGAVTITSLKNMDEVRVTNILGQLIYTAQLKQTQFNFELKNEGMYFVTITSGNELVTRKLVVSK